MLKYRSSMAYGQRQIAFDAANEGNKGGTDDAAAKAAADAAAADTKAAEEAAAADAQKAADEAAEAEAALAAANKDGTKTSKAAEEEKAALLREVMDKKNKLKTAQEALEAYEGVDPAKVKALVAAEKAAEQAALEAKGEFDRVKQMMADQHAAETKALKDQVEAAQKVLADKDKIIDNLTVGNDFGTSTYIKENLTLSPTKARVIYGAHFEVVDGVTIAYDKPASDATRTQIVDASGKPVSFDVALKRIIEADPDKNTMLKSTVKPGGASKTEKTDTTTKPKNDGLYGVSRIAATLADLK